MRAALVAVLWHCAAARIRRVEVRALGTTPRLGGPLATPAAQKVLGAGLLSPVPLSWENALPTLSAWLDHSILPRIASVTTAGRRYQLLMNVGLTAKMPALAARIPPAIAADLEATREMARASVSTVLPF